MSENNFIGASETFLDSNGREWVLSPIGIKELKELENFLRSEPIQTVNSIEGLNEADKRYLLDKAYADIAKIRIGTRAFDEAANSMSGVSHLLYLSIRKNHKDITKASAEELVTLNNLQEIGDKITRLMGVASPNVKKAVTVV